MKSFKTGFVIVFMLLLLVGGVFAWSYVKIGNTFIVTLDSGRSVNVTNVSVDNAHKTLNAIIITPRLTIQEAVNLQNITQMAYESLPGKKDTYEKNVLIIQN